MNLSVNGQSQVPPGFRFHPTEEELLHYYLKKKVSCQKIDLDVIQDVDLNKLEPWDIQEKCKIGSGPQNDWYFFSHKDKKYPTGTRTNRATTAGFWKATGRDKVICGSSKPIGMRKTLVFYMGRAPHGEKSDWIMHEYRLDDNTHCANHACNHLRDQGSGSDEGWVVCRVFCKKNYIKTLQNPTNQNPVSQSTTRNNSRKTTLSTISKPDTKPYNSTHQPNKKNITQDEFLHLPHLDSPTNPSYDPQTHQDCNNSMMNWVELDRLVACQLNGQANYVSSESTKPFSCFNNNTLLNDDNDGVPLCDNYAGGDTGRSTSESGTIDDQLWRFIKEASLPTSLDPSCHF